MKKVNETIPILVLVFGFILILTVLRPEASMLELGMIVTMSSLFLERVRR